VPDLTKFIHPDIRLHGPVDDKMLNDFFGQLDHALSQDDPILLELMTAGGTADVGRRIAQHIKMLREAGREMNFLGATTVYSAGITIMGGFALENRYLTRDTTLLIHERQAAAYELPRGPLSAVIQIANSKVSEMANGLKLQRDDFKDLIEGTDVSEEEIYSKARSNWYIPADEALQRRLVASVI